MKRAYYELRRVVFVMGAVILSPFIYFFISYRKPRASDDKPIRILIIPHLTRIGDLMCATPVFRAIKEEYPDAQVAVLVAGRLEGLLRNNRSVDEIIIYRHFDLWGTIKKIRSGNFDWSFSLSGTSISSVISFLSLIPSRTKITRRPRPFSEFLTDWTANYHTRYEYHTYLPRRYLDMLKFIGIESPREEKELGISPEGERKAKIHSFDVGISVSAGNKIKEWGDFKFLELARKIKEKYSARVVFIGSKNEEERLRKLVGGEFAVVCDFNLEEIPSMLKRLKLFIAVDTGLIHMAHALKVPLIDIIGPVDSREQSPSDEYSIRVLPSLGIKPSCFAFEKPGGKAESKKAIESIKVEDVERAVDKLLKE